MVDKLKSWADELDAYFQKFDSSFFENGVDASDDESNEDGVSSLYLYKASTSHSTSVYSSRVHIMRNQRIVGPPLNYLGDRPGNGTEVFVTQLPLNVFEDEIIPIFESIGPIYEFRILMHNNYMNRGYCYITYFKIDDANKAIATLNNYPIAPTHRLLVTKSINNCRLFIGNIPNDLIKEDLIKFITEAVSGVKDVILYQCKIQRNLNRGFAFIEFNTHREAVIALKSLSDGTVKFPWNRRILIDWSVPLPEVHPQIMEKVTIIFIRNLNVNLTKEDILYNLDKFLNIKAVTRVHKMHDYCFVHFDRRDHAEAAMQKLMVHWHGKYDGIEVTWARPRRFSANRFYCENETKRMTSHYKSLPYRMKMPEIRPLNFPPKRDISCIACCSYERDTHASPSGDPSCSTASERDGDLATNMRALSPEPITSTPRRTLFSSSGVSQSLSPIPPMSAQRLQKRKPTLPTSLITNVRTIEEQIAERELLLKALSFLEYYVHNL